MYHNMLFYSRGEGGECEVSFNYSIPKKDDIDLMIGKLQEISSLGDAWISEQNRISWLERDAEIRSWSSRTKRKKIPGTIYLIKSGEFYKIGKSKNFVEREKTYKTENPFETEVIFKVEVDDYTGEEKKLLDRYKDKKHRGEWFRLSSGDVEEIKGSFIK